MSIKDSYKTTAIGDRRNWHKDSAFICRSPCRLQLASMKWSRQVTHLPCQCATADLLASADVPFSLAHQRFGGGGQLRSSDVSGITSRVCHHETFFLGSPKKKKVIFLGACSDKDDWRLNFCKRIGIHPARADY